MVRTFSRARDGAVQVAPNFRLSEFAANCGQSCCASDEVLLDERLPHILQRVRELCGNNAVRINSGYRSPAHNARIGGASQSNHMKGMAADITINGVGLETICRAAETALKEANMPGGIILYPVSKFVHIDTRTTRYRGIDDGTLRSSPGWTPLPATTPANPPAVVAPTPVITGDNSKITWISLEMKGLGIIAIAGLSGNIFAESAHNPTALERRAFGRLKINGVDVSDAIYTQTVDNGTYTREQFINDGYGYGICQWTFWSRKAALYDYAKSVGKSIGDSAMQHEFLWIEINKDFLSMLTALRAATTIRAASDIVLTRFMKPADQSVRVQELRAGYAQREYDKFSNQSATPTPPSSFVAYNVRVTGTPLIIRSGAGTNNAEIGRITDNRIFTVTDEADGQGASKWLRVITGERDAQDGWISRDFTQRL